MTVFVNDKEVKIFTGACAKDAVRQYLCLNDQDVKTLNSCVIYDSYGHEIGMDAPLSENQKIRIEQAG